MQKRQLNLQLDTQVIKQLSSVGDRYGLSANAILAAAACELSRIRPENLWHALGRIAAGEALEVMPTDREPLPAAKKPIRRALPA